MKGRKGKEADLSVKRIIVKSLHDALERERAANPNYVVVLDSDRFTTSYDNILCYQMCFATERFKDLFAPPVQSQNESRQFSTGGFL